jgi:hypothetical protein
VEPSPTEYTMPSKCFAEHQAEHEETDSGGGNIFLPREQTQAAWQKVAGLQGSSGVVCPGSEDFNFARMLY